MCKVELNCPHCGVASTVGNPYMILNAREAGLLYNNLRDAFLKRDSTLPEMRKTIDSLYNHALENKEIDEVGRLLK